jgi:hypothetical protein
MIESLQQRYSQSQLNSLPQYKQLLHLQKTLTPLLPESMREPSTLKVGSKLEDLDEHKLSQSQYLRIKLLQDKIAKLERVYVLKILKLTLFQSF